MKLSESDKFCPACGNSAPAMPGGPEQESEIYSFGPMGVKICFSRPSTFGWTVKNMTKVTLTNREIYGTPKSSLVPTKLLPFKSSAQFQVPYNTILGVEHVSLGLWKGVWIQYLDENKTKEVSILCDPTNSHHIPKVYDLLQAAKTGIGQKV
jgi:hypothetical protein